MVRTEQAAGPPPAARRVDRGSAAALGIAAILVGASMLGGWTLTRNGVDLHLGSTYPLSGQYALHLGWWSLVAVFAAGAAVTVAPWAAATLPWPRLLALSFLASAGWAAALAVVAGTEAIAAPLMKRWEYLAEVDRVNEMGVATYLDSFTRYILGGLDAPEWTTHVAGHPPLPTLAFALLARAGLDDPVWAATLCILGGSAAAPAVLSTLRVTGGEPLARRAAPFVVFAPVALWVATSADALFAGVAAWAVCLLAHAATRSGWRSPALAAAGGVLLGLCLMMSYGLILIALIGAAVVLAGRRGWSRRAAVVLLVAGVGAVLMLAALAVAGFWWPEGLELTAERVRRGPGWQDRPTAYFLLANQAALAIAAGPAVVAALPYLWRLRERGSWPAAPGFLPAGAAMAAMALAIASNLSKGEVERIYLPFMVWLLPIAALLAVKDRRPSAARRWLAAQTGWAVLVAVTTRLTW